jgi:hypothetical protein
MLVPMEVLHISCEECVMRATSACGDCLVTYLCDRDEEEAVVLDITEQIAVRLLAEAGLVPTLRHRAVNR